MKLLKNIICAAILLAGVSTMAQQDPNRSFYRYNMNLINPAYAGANTGTEVSNAKVASEIGLNFRSQWLGVAGAPETQSIFFGTPMGKNVGLGVSIINDQTFIENQTSLTIDFSYKLSINDETDLFLGIKAGANSYNANTVGLETFGIGSDASLTNLNGGFKPNVGAGAYLRGEDYFVSLSIPNIISTERLEEDNGIATLGASRSHAYLGFGYDFSLGGNLKFKPSALARYVEAAPLSLDITAGFNFNEKIELGTSYRINEGFGGYALFNITPWADLGYAYEAAFENLVSSGDQGTHEIFMKLSL